ncbi:hypothetical protein ACVWWG_006667 [Bradyrhizobium sp. LB7.2]
MSLAGSGGQIRPRGEVSASFGGAGDGGAEGRIRVVVDQALPHRAVACELDDPDVLLSQSGEGEHRERILVQRRRADDEADALAFEVLQILHAGIGGDAKRTAVAVDRREHDLKRLRAPFSGSKLEHAFLREVGARSHRGRDRALGAQRRETRDVVACGEHAHVGRVFVLHHLADADRDVEAGGAGVIGGERQCCRQLDVFGGCIACRRKRNARHQGRREHDQPTKHVSLQ